MVVLTNVYWLTIPDMLRLSTMYYYLCLSNLFIQVLPIDIEHTVCLHTSSNRSNSYYIYYIVIYVVNFNNKKFIIH